MKLDTNELAVLQASLVNKLDALKGERIKKSEVKRTVNSVFNSYRYSENGLMIELPKCGYEELLFEKIPAAKGWTACFGKVAVGFKALSDYMNILCNEESFRARTHDSVFEVPDANFSETMDKVEKLISDGYYRLALLHCIDLLKDRTETLTLAEAYSLRGAVAGFANKAEINLSEISVQADLFGKLESIHDTEMDEIE